MDAIDFSGLLPNFQSLVLILLFAHACALCLVEALRVGKAPTRGEKHAHPGSRSLKASDSYSVYVVIWLVCCPVKCVPR